MEDGTLLAVGTPGGMLYTPANVSSWLAVTQVGAPVDLVMVSVMQDGQGRHDPDRRRRHLAARPA